MPLTIGVDMTEANIDHPTAGRRRRHKSPPTLYAPVALPVPRLDDRLDTENGPSDEEGEKGCGFYMKTPKIVSVLACESPQNAAKPEFLRFVDMLQRQCENDRHGASQQRKPLAQVKVEWANAQSKQGKFGPKH